MGIKTKWAGKIEVPHPINEGMTIGIDIQNSECEISSDLVLGLMNGIPDLIKEIRIATEAPLDTLMGTAAWPAAEGRHSPSRISSFVETLKLHTNRGEKIENLLSSLEKLGVRVIPVPLR